MYKRQGSKIDILVNNAGMQHRAPLEDFPSEKFELLMQTNVSSIFNVGQAVAKRMIEEGRGKIINIASVQTALARPGIAPYTATKGAVSNLTKGMATDWASKGIQVNAIAPGYFNTPLNSALEPESNCSMANSDAHNGISVNSILLSPSHSQHSLCNIPHKLSV